MFNVNAHVGNYGKVVEDLHAEVRLECVGYHSSCLPPIYNIHFISGGVEIWIIVCNKFKRIQCINNNIFYYISFLQFSCTDFMRNFGSKQMWSTALDIGVINECEIQTNGSLITIP